MEGWKVMRHGIYMGRAVPMDDLERLAALGVGDAQYSLAVEYEKVCDYAHALHWYAVSYAHGCVRGGCAAADICSRLGKDIDAVKWCEKASSMGDVEAQWRLGLLYEEGRGVEVDFRKAKELYEKACNGSLVSKQACWRLGRLYDLGLGCSRDRERARECYGKVLCESPRDLWDIDKWVCGAEWAELYYRYAELLKDGGCPKTILSLYERAARYNNPKAREAYVLYWLAHKDEEGDRYSHVGRGGDWVVEFADRGNYDAIRYLACTNARYAWKSLRLGDKDALGLLISHYWRMWNNRDADRFEALKGDRLCAIVRNKNGRIRPFREAAKHKAEMMAVFKEVSSGSKPTAEAYYKLHRWGVAGLLENWYDSTWLEHAAELGYKPAVEEIAKKRVVEKRRKAAELEKQYTDEIRQRLSGESAWRGLDSSLYPRLLEKFSSLAIMGDIEACKVMAEVYRNGHYGVRKDVSTCARWMVAAAKAGDEQAMRSACALKIGAKERYDLSVRLANLGDVQATLRCAEMLAKGEGCVRDMQMAVSMWERIDGLPLSDAESKICAWRRLYQVYSSGIVCPKDAGRMNELRMALLVEEGVESTVAAKNVLYAIFHERVPVDKFGRKLKKVLALGSSLGHPLSHSEISREGAKYSSRAPLFHFEPDLSCLLGELTDVILCLYDRQMEAPRCKENLYRLYSLSENPDLLAYRERLRDTVSVENHPVLKSLDDTLFNSGYLSRSDVDKALCTRGLLPDQFFAILRVLGHCGMWLKEPLPIEQGAAIRLPHEYQGDCVRQYLRDGVGMLLSNKLPNEEDGGRRDNCETLYWLRRYSDKGDSRASYICGRYYLQGARILEFDRLSERYLQRCAGTSADAVYWLGRLYADLRGELRDFGKACVLMRKAYEFGSVAAAAALGDLCLQYCISAVCGIEFARIYGEGEVSDALVKKSLVLGGGQMNTAEEILCQAVQWYRVGKERGHDYSMFKYGMCLIQGVGGVCDNAVGRFCVKEASSLGCTHASVYIALQHWCLPTGEKREKDLVLKHLRYAMRLGSECARTLYKQLEDREERPRIPDTYSDSLLDGWPIGMFNSGFWSEGILNDGLCEAGSIKLFKEGCKCYAGVQAYGYNGYVYDSAEKDRVKARLKLAQSAVLGYVPAITMLGVMYERNPRVRTMSFKLFELASLFGDGYASWRLSRRRIGKIWAGNISFEKMLQGASALDQWGCGYCCENVLHDYLCAVAYYEKSASRGFTSAMVSLGRCLMSGVGVDKDLRRAYALFSEAAYRGDIGGCYFLGKCYEQGIGCDIDWSMAFTFYVKAARHGYVSARRWIARQKSMCSKDRYTRCESDANGDIESLYFLIANPRKFQMYSN